MGNIEWMITVARVYPSSYKSFSFNVWKVLKGQKMSEAFGQKVPKGMKQETEVLARPG